jgi:hypothetical protein
MIIILYPIPIIKDLKQNIYVKPYKNRKFGNVLDCGCVGFVYISKKYSWKVTSIQPNLP